ncbi:hypothetical protein BDF20DRAFT_804082, partial [Mycotypha africana]|uniref:uncharacterized protein n=1 Tax=Mycotypha africana TaxID=64632 RepID=UPI002300D120
MPSSPPFLNYRAGVAVGSTFYMPFINESSFCYAYDLHSGVWSFHKLHLIEHDVIYPQVTCAAVLGKKIYLVCGRLLNSYTLSNGMIEIDTTNFNMRIVKDAKGVPPRPRHEHSIDAIGDRYLVLFGGLCYNSVGENDVFVYDQHENKWFIPPISGYIVFDDLHKLDCETWTWYKYDHPEKERYLRHQTSEKETVNSPQEDYVIPTYGDSPYDRFQAFMCSHGSKLIIFGGHSIREDDDDNEILCSYSVDELCIFNTKRKVWSTTRAAIIDRADEPVTVSDMSIAQFLIDSNGLRVFIIAGRKAPE